MTAIESVDDGPQTDTELVSCITSFGTGLMQWPGLTSYRFTGPTARHGEGFPGLALDIVGQGREAVTILDGRRYVYGQFDYLVMGALIPVRSEVLQASPETPALACVCSSIRRWSGARRLRCRRTVARPCRSARPWTPAPWHRSTTT